MMLKFAVVLPAEIVFWAGGTAAELFDENFITAPPVGAAALSTTEPRLAVPPTTVDGEIVKLEMVGNAMFTVRVADFELDP